MPRLKSVQLSARRFQQELAKLRTFVDDAQFSQSAGISSSWIHEYAIIRIYKEFEGLMLDALVGAINHDTTVLSETLGFKFPKNLTDEVAEFLVTGGGYFDFKGRDGLIKIIKQFLPEEHYLLRIVSKRRYRNPLEQLCALRNYAAHDSDQAKRKAREATGLKRIGTAGSYMKKQKRFHDMVNRLEELAGEIRHVAPY